MQWIELPCKPSDTLDWKKPLEQARTSVAKGERIAWRCLLGMETPYYPLGCEMQFQAASLAMTQFTDVVWPEFQEWTDYICLYRGTAHFHSFFAWTERQRDDLIRFGDPEFVFCADAYAIYFRMLMSRLPDEAKILLLFDLSGFASRSQALQIVSKDSFEHFTIGLRGIDIPLEGLWWEEDLLEMRTIATNAAVVLPTEPCQRVEKLCSLPGVKILFEQNVSEEWEGIDRLYVLKGSLSVQGVRKLSGFQAAGGEIIEI